MRVKLRMIPLGLLLVLCEVAQGVPVDNGVEGDPEIECGPTSITVNFNTRNSFEGHVYVKGLYNEPGCRNDEGGRSVAGIELPFDLCSTRRIRSLNPKGVFVTTTVIVTFHPLFVTKVDRAYRIQCFYMEADKTVDTNIRVSMLTTEFQTQQVPMPVCRYEILDGPVGNPVTFARVGEPVYHKWTCDSETVETFCMVVHSCFVDDTNGEAVTLIDEEGCAEDLYLLNNPEYSADLMAGVEAHVFKYADRADLYFQCQISILVKEPGVVCPRPDCPVPAGRGAGEANPSESAGLGVEEAWPPRPGSPYLPIPSLRRRKRSPSWRRALALGEADVTSSLATLDVSESTGTNPPQIPRPQFEQHCISTPAFIAILILGAIIATIAALLLMRRLLSS